MLAASGAVRRPFAVINADDFYGAAAYQELARHLGSTAGTAGRPQYALVGYRLRQTLSEHGAVNRGLCRVDAAGRVTGIDEVLRIERTPDGTIRHPRPDGGWTVLSGDETVSMTCFGFTPAFLGQLGERFGAFLARHGTSATAECYLPVAVGEIVRDGAADLRLLKSADAWFGMTYREDVAATAAAVRGLIAQGVYPERLDAAR